jgi:hypothetical protein
LLEVIMHRRLTSITSRAIEEYVRVARRVGLALNIGEGLSIWTDVVDAENLVRSGHGGLAVVTEWLTAAASMPALVLVAADSPLDTRVRRADGQSVAT